MPRSRKIASTAVHIIRRKQRISFSSEVSFSRSKSRQPPSTHALIDKHGQLGIWDARAPPDEVGGEDGDVPSVDDREGGKYWRLQPHWPATAKSSVTSVKFDPIDSHSVCIRQTSDLRPSG